MNSLALLVAATALGVDFGWQPTNYGDLEYIIQIEPALIQALGEGDEITNVIPKELRGIRRFRIVVGNHVLPKQGQLPAHLVEQDEDKNLTPSLDISSGNPDPVANPRSNGVVPPTSNPKVPNGTDSSVPKIPSSPLLEPPPDLLSPDPVSGPLPNRQAVFMEGETAGKEPERSTPFTATAADSSTDEPVANAAKPWLPLILIAIGLFASIGLNVYLGWIARGIYIRYRAALQQLKSSRTTAVA